MNDQLYRQQIIDHYRNPKNSGILDPYDSKMRVFNTSCGDEVEAYIRVENGKLKAVSFDTRGCAISVAAASLLSEEVIGMDLDEIMELNEEFIQELLGTQLTSSRIKCGMLGLDGLKRAIEAYRNSHTDE